MTTTQNRIAKALLGTALAVTVLPFVLTACTSSKADDASSASSSVASGDSLAECLVDRGYDESAFAGSGGEGVQTLTRPAGVDESQWREDMKSCMGSGESFGSTAGSANDDPEVEKKFVACMVDKGYEDFPETREERPEYLESHPGSMDDSAACFKEELQ
jgi:hypothetical protein